MSGSLLSRFREHTGAAAAAEMALVLPMAFALIFTTMEAGYYFQTEHKAIKYVREGARYAARMNFQYYDCSGSGGFSTSPDSSSVQTQIRNVTLTGFVTGGSPRIEGWEAGDILLDVDCDSSYGTGIYSQTEHLKAPIVTVSTRFGYDPLIGLLGFDVSQTNVVAQAQAAVGGL